MAPARKPAFASLLALPNIVSAPPRRPRSGKGLRPPSSICMCQDASSPSNGPATSSSSAPTPSPSPSPSTSSSPSLSSRTRPPSRLGTYSEQVIPRRSKMILTRRVSSWELRNRLNTAHTPIPKSPNQKHRQKQQLQQQQNIDSIDASSVDFAYRSPTLDPDFDQDDHLSRDPKQQQHQQALQQNGRSSATEATILGQRIPPDAQPLETLLDPAEPVASFVFTRGQTPFNVRRRPGDPPARFLILRYGLVEPFSLAAAHCSNPRATGSLKNWYQNAIRWNVISTDLRPPLILDYSRRARSPPPLRAPPPPHPYYHDHQQQHQHTDESNFEYANDSSARQERENNQALENPGKDSTQRHNSFDRATDTADIGTEADKPQEQQQDTREGDVQQSQSLRQSLRQSQQPTLVPIPEPPPPPPLGQPVPPVSPLLTQSRWDRALGRSPRVIVIGDVHGCIDELQELLRLADFQPGDQVVLLGDLVAKGPDSAGVVQLAREIGARAVRGNHDFEVVRWFEAQTRGDASSMVSLEHAKIARALGKLEHAWLVDCPWFIECADMGHLFVHAGFIPGVKLTQQNPRLMMNMRSVLSDGTVTAKNVLDCEWAKLWKGPQTVVFGHDAFRGLQEHEFAKGIDTGCVYGGRLTALLLPENRLISVSARRAYVAPKRFRVMREH